MTFDELYAAVEGSSAVAKLHEFVASGGDINYREDDNAWTLLHCACEHMNHDLIRVLGKYGANPNTQTSGDGWSPLHHAVDIDIDSYWQATHDESFEQLRFETTRLILSLGADPNVRMSDGQTARQLAAEYGDKPLAQYDKYVGHNF